MKKLVLGTALAALFTHGNTAAPAQEVEAPIAMKPAPDANFDAGKFAKVLAAYDRIVAALAADRLDGVKDAAAVIVENAPNGVVAKRAGALSGGGASTDIAAVREAVKPLSTAVIDYAGANRPTLLAALKESEQAMPQLAYCPMAEAAWLQHGDKIANPYYGASMLRCGKFEAWGKE